MFHITKTGDVYRGNWENGSKSGAGVYEYKDGELGEGRSYPLGGSLSPP